MKPSLRSIFAGVLAMLALVVSGCGSANPLASDVDARFSVNDRQRRVKAAFTSP